METSILKKALISEKSFGKAAESKFTFIVERSATKAQIAVNVQEIFGVEVVDVNVANIIGKVKRSKKGMGKRSDYKKAVVTLKKGQKIDLFEIEQPEKNEKGKAKKEKADKKTDKIENESTDTTVKVREKKK